MTGAVQNLNHDVIVIHDSVLDVGAFHVGVVVTDEASRQKSNYKRCDIHTTQNMAITNDPTGFVSYPLLCPTINSRLSRNGTMQ